MIEILGAAVSQGDYVEYGGDVTTTYLVDGSGNAYVKGMTDANGYSWELPDYRMVRLVEREGRGE